MNIDESLRKIVADEVSKEIDRAIAEIKSLIQNQQHMNSSEHGETLNVEEVSTILSISKSKVYEMARQNKIPHRKAGSKFIFPTRAFYRWLDGQ